MVVQPLEIWLDLPDWSLAGERANSPGLTVLFNPIAHNYTLIEFQSLGEALRQAVPQVEDCVTFVRSETLLRVIERADYDERRQSERRN
jgi:hypothetical protein